MITAIAIPGLYKSAIQPINGEIEAAKIDLACELADSVVAIAFCFDKLATIAKPIGLRRFSITIIRTKPIIENTKR